jgi:hypothetical protein
LRVNRRFQFVDARKEFPTLSRRQRLHLLQNFVSRSSFESYHKRHAQSKLESGIFFDAGN